MRTNLKVPFAEKDDVKQLGARWDPTRKLWYIENAADLAPFARWLTTAHTPNAAAVTPSKHATSTVNQSEGITVVGSRYVSHPRVCDCLPWDECERCKPFALLD